MNINDLSQNDIARFQSKIQINEETECHEWTASLSDKGYGLFWLKGKKIKTHRLAWLIYSNVWPGDLLVRHYTCGNRKCCNPQHLLLGTAKENYQDMVKDGTLQPINETSKKLTWLDVDTIRALFNEKIDDDNDKLTVNFFIVEMSQRFDVMAETIKNIIKHKTWKES